MKSLYWMCRGTSACSLLRIHSHDPPLPLPESGVRADTRNSEKGRPSFLSKNQSWEGGFGCSLWSGSILCSCVFPHSHAILLSANNSSAWYTIALRYMRQIWKRYVKLFAIAFQKMSGFLASISSANVLPQIVRTKKAPMCRKISIERSGAVRPSASTSCDAWFAPINYTSSWFEGLS